MLIERDCTFKTLLHYIRAPRCPPIRSDVVRRGN